MGWRNACHSRELAAVEMKVCYPCILQPTPQSTHKIDVRGTLRLLKRRLKRPSDNQLRRQGTAVPSKHRSPTTRLFDVEEVRGISVTDSTTTGLYLPLRDPTGVPHALHRSPLTPKEFCINIETQSTTQGSGLHLTSVSAAADAHKASGSEYVQTRCIHIHGSQVLFLYSRPTYE